VQFENRPRPPAKWDAGPSRPYCSRRDDLERFHAYIFSTENTGRDYVYKVVSINGVPFQKSALTREEHISKRAYADVNQFTFVIARRFFAISKQLD
jgi:hypothetical protein